MNPDPKFWQELDPDLDPELCDQFWKKNLKIIKEKKIFLNKYCNLFQPEENM